MAVEKTDNAQYLELAIEEARQGVLSNSGGPFGCVVVKDGKIVGRGRNSVTSTNDPTAHAEVNAIRDACAHLQTFQLDGCDIYTSCEPCPMCLGAIYWARPNNVFFAASRYDAAKSGFDDDFIYKEILLDTENRHIHFEHITLPTATHPFELWNNHKDKTSY